MKHHPELHDTLVKDDSRLAGHGLRRCGFAQYDYAVIHNDKHRGALATLINQHLGDDHPGYTLAEVNMLEAKRRGSSVYDKPALASALALQGGAA